MSSKELGARLKTARKRRGFSQVALSKSSGVDQSMISKYERGAVIPHFETLMVLLESLELEIQFVESEAPS